MKQTKQTTQKPPTPDPDGEDKDIVKVILPRALGERFRNAVDALSGPPLRLKLSPAGVEAFEEWTAAREQAHNKGRPFPDRKAGS